MSCSIIQQHLKEHTMLYFNFKLSNPFKVKERGQRNFVEWDRTLTKNKAMEFQVSFWGSFRELFVVGVDTRWTGQDHAGIKIDMTVFGFGFVLNLYDIRHWNYDTDSWEQYPGEAWNDDEIVG